MKLFETKDLKFRTPRIWSNQELQKFAHFFTGTVVNVSAFEDADKEGKRYKDYFTAAESYSKTNYSPDGVLQEENDIFLDLEKDLPVELEQSFDVVFNHTVLEHVYNIQTAFSNLCKMSRNAVIIIVPFVQQFHGFVDYNDFWRFTPEAMKKMFADNGIALRYCSANAGDHASIYLFCIGYKDMSLDKYIPARFDISFAAKVNGGPAKLNSAIGANVISNSFLDRILFLRRRASK